MFGVLKAYWLWFGSEGSVTFAVRSVPKHIKSSKPQEYLMCYFRPSGHGQYSPEINKPVDEKGTLLLSGKLNTL